jgi:type I restriction enzyme R subunit
VVFVVNGLPLVIGEAKTPTRSAVTWFDGAFQINQIYEKEVPAMFVPNVFSFATEGRLFRYGSIRMPIEMWGHGATTIIRTRASCSTSRPRSRACCGRR